MCGRTGVQAGVQALLVASVFWMSGCSRGHEETNAPSTANVQQVTLHVPGMIDRQGIT
jgi:hypothetical protein